jgi:hypothetical protein
MKAVCSRKALPRGNRAPSEDLRRGRHSIPKKSNEDKGSSIRNNVKSKFLARTWSRL